LNDIKETEAHSKVFLEMLSKKEEYLMRIFFFGIKIFLLILNKSSW